MVRDDIRRHIEPKLGHLREDGAFFGDLVLEDVIESGDAVRCDHDNAVTCVIDFAYFTGFKRGVFFHLVWPP